MIEIPIGFSGMISQLIHDNIIYVINRLIQLLFVSLSTGTIFHSNTVTLLLPYDRTATQTALV